MRILIVEDDRDLADAIAETLKRQNYATDIVADGETAWHYIETYEYDLLLLDVVLPQTNGISLCRQLRSRQYTMPIFLLTALDTKRDKILGLDAGADDYLVKPIDLEELVARMRALLRRGSLQSFPVLGWEKLRLDPSTYTVTYDGKPLRLTPKEYSLLELFLRHQSRVFSPYTILEHLWSIEDPPSEATVRAHIKRLRRALQAAGGPKDAIETVYGLGYRLKKMPATAPETPPSEQTSHAISPHSQPTLQTITQVWQRVRQKVFQRIDRIAESLNMLATGDRHSCTSEPANGECWKQAYNEVHKLAGCLGTFGFPEASKTAQQLEQQLQQPASLSTEDIQQIQLLLEQLQGQLQAQTAESKGMPAGNEDPPEEENNDNFLLLVSRDRHLLQTIPGEAQAWGYTLQTATSLKATQQVFTESTGIPQVLLLDLEVCDRVQDSLDWLASFHHNASQIPVVAIHSSDNFRDRLQVARLGGRAFLQKPLSPFQAMEAVWEIQQNKDATGTILIVDDNREQLVLLEQLLHPWGFRTRTLQDSTHFWPTLQQIQPDLLILDVEMPKYSGIELCQVLRNDPQWRELPVLFLTVHKDTQTVTNIFAAGGDDYIGKPLIGPELVTRVFNRLERRRLLRNLADCDPLTGLANRRKSSQQFKQYIRLSQRQGLPLCFAIFDLDRFKQVNDTYGHATGDLVLHRLGRFLQKAFREEDIVARWGGEEFVIGMYGIYKQDAIARLGEIRKQWHQEKIYTSQEEVLSITLSGGVSEYPEDGSDLHTLYKTADAALYQAKQAGRDRVFGYQGENT
ncbi:response regulator [Geitlerinema sp. PCC 9228]|uniref:response regulator n=1 Tax=Geitlerinema sp. PCC 9228 TaxID=111611 RepID=UPI0008F9C41B|nr:response regulator [Geitlerinema sp. PCC 9228]